MANEQPVTRKERFLAGAAGEDITLDTPITREERFLAKAAGMDVKTDDPVTRSEKYLAKIAEGGGGGGGSVPEYEGSYSVTPSESAQTLSCKDKKMTDDVSVSAISSTYIGSGVTQKAAATYTPTTSDQTIAANQYLSGAQTVKGDANLVAGNIKKDTQIFGVTGTYEGSGGGGGGGSLKSESISTEPQLGSILAKSDFFSRTENTENNICYLVLEFDWETYSEIVMADYLVLPCETVGGRDGNFTATFAGAYHGAGAEYSVKVRYNTSGRSITECVQKDIAGDYDEDVAEYIMNATIVSIDFR